MLVFWTLPIFHWYFGAKYLPITNRQVASTHILSSIRSIQTKVQNSETHLTSTTTGFLCLINLFKNLVQNCTIGFQIDLVINLIFSSAYHVLCGQVNVHRYQKEECWYCHFSTHMPISNIFGNFSRLGNLELDKHAQFALMYVLLIQFQNILFNIGYCP